MFVDVSTIPVDPNHISPAVNDSTTPVDLISTDEVNKFIVLFI